MWPRTVTEAEGLGSGNARLCSTKLGPSTSATRWAESARRHWATRRPSFQTAKATSGRASAWRRTASRQCANSVASVLRNLRRAGVAKNSSRTSTVVPTPRAAGCSSPLQASIRLACGASCVRLVRLSSATEAIAASASPRNPMVATDSRSDRLAILLVAWRRSAQGQLRGRYAAAVVLDHDGTHACGLQAHAYLGGAGIQRVVDQLADHGCGALDHFPGGNLADQFVGELANLWPGVGCHRRIITRSAPRAYRRGSVNGGSGHPA
jgi:hypothetical protein